MRDKERPLPARRIRICFWSGDGICLNCSAIRKSSQQDNPLLLQKLQYKLHDLIPAESTLHLVFQDIIEDGIFCIDENNEV